MTTIVFRRLALIGIGLIRASIALSARRAGGGEHTAISSRTSKTLARAAELKLGDSYEEDAADAAGDADCVILCSPVGTYAAIAEAIAPSLKRGAVVSDVGSVKAAVVAAIGPHL